MNRRDIKRIIVQAIMGFILWTIILSPYMVFIVKTSEEQFVDWIMMQGIIIPPVAPFVVWVTNKVTKRFIK